MGTKKLSISFSEHYADVYQYLKSKPNISLFICQLVRAEMNTKDIATPELEATVEEIIKKILKENHYSFNSNFQDTTSKNIINSLTEDDKSLIKDLF